MFVLKVKLASGWCVWWAEEAVEQGAQLGVDSLQRHLLALVFARLQVMKGTCTMLEAAQYLRYKVKLKRRMQKLQK